MQRIVVQGYQADGYVADGNRNNRAQHEATNRPLLQQWFEANQDKLSLVADHLTKKLGEEKFKNMTLSNPRITWDEVKFSDRLYLTPKSYFQSSS
ncbi:hypothetical protein ABC610_03600 [Mycoplasmopsis synoviae]|uniref:hypothetical protein n=1 Tax=Mycoplasmopsis synoviae TaxID=2109 RepID=UPI00349E7539